MLKRFLEKFREIPRGAPFRDVFTAEWANAVQDCLRALSAGENITIEGDMTRSPGDGAVRLGSRRRFQPMGRGSRGRFKVTFNPRLQRLHVSEGSVYQANSEEDHQSIKPEIPTLNSVSLTQNPYWGLEGITTGVVYNVWCVIGGDSTESKMQLRKDSEAVEWAFPEENALCVAHLTFKNAEGGGGLAIDGKIHQDWDDNIEWFNAKGSGSSSDSSSGDDDDSSDGGGGSSGGDDDDSSGIIEESNDDDSSEESSSEDESSDGIVCPDIEIVEIMPIAINGALAEDGFLLCFSDTSDPPDGVPNSAYLTVVVHVRVGPTPPGCYPYVRVSAGSGSGWTNVTVPAGTTATVPVQLTFWASPSSPYTVYAALRHPIGFSGCAALNDCPQVSKVYMTPGGC